MLGFMKRILKPIDDPSVYLSLYHSLIRSRLEYCSFIWSPLCQTNIDKIERVQKKFVNYVSYKCRLSNVSYLELCVNFKLQPLQSRREMLDVRMLNKVLNDRVDCPELLSMVPFRVPTRLISRRRDLFACNHRIRARQNSPITRSTSLANRSDLDVLSPVNYFRNISYSYFTY